MPPREMSAVGQLVCLLLLCGCALSQSNGGVPSSPCPNVFQYIYDRGGGLQGRISIVPPLSFSRVKLELQMTVTYYPLVGGYGGIFLRGGVRERQEIANKAQRNEQQTIQFIVMFPPGQPVPRVNQVVINGKDFCPNSIKYSDTRGEINLTYDINTSLPLAVVGGDQFYAPGTNPVYTSTARPVARPGQNVRPAERPVQKPYEPKPIPTQFPSDVYHTFPTQFPYIEPESSTTQRPYVPPRNTQRPYESHTTKPKTPPQRPSSANNGQSESRPQHNQCNVYPATVIDCLKQCYQQQENHNAQSRHIGNRHVHVCNLPTEIENDKIGNKLAEYGDVFNVTDELWTGEFLYKVKTGVRSVSMVLDRHIPEVVEIEGHDGLINYECQPMKCHENCGSAEPRSGCPKNVPYNTPSAN